MMNRPKVKPEQVRPSSIRNSFLYFRPILDNDTLVLRCAIGDTEPSIGALVPYVLDIEPLAFNPPEDWEEADKVSVPKHIERHVARTMVSIDRDCEAALVVYLQEQYKQEP